MAEEVSILGVIFGLYSLDLTSLCWKVSRMFILSTSSTSLPN
jgi:hypothetical protein